MWTEKGEVLFILEGTPLRGMGEVEAGRKMKKLGCLLFPRLIRR